MGCLLIAISSYKSPSYPVINPRLSQETFAALMVPANLFATFTQTSEMRTGSSSKASWTLGRASVHSGGVTGAPRHSVDNTGQGLGWTPPSHNQPIAYQHAIGNRIAFWLAVIGSLRIWVSCAWAGWMDRVPTNSPCNTLSQPCYDIQSQSVRCFQSASRNELTRGMLAGFGVFTIQKLIVAGKVSAHMLTLIFFACAPNPLLT